MAADTSVVQTSVQTTAWPMPMGLFDEQNEPLRPEQIARWVWIFLLVGAIARVVRYAVNFPLWIDECLLASNLLDRDYAGLLKALDYYQVCPFLYLWLQFSIVNLLGFGEHTLRLFSLICGLASLLLFRHLASRLLKGTSLLFAVAIFAVSYPCIRYSVEAKQYGGEMFVALTMLVLAVEWWRRPTQTGWLWALAAFVPVAIGFSYTAVFLGAAISLLIGAVLWQRGLSRGWAPWGVFNVLLAGSFSAVYVLAASNQSAGALAYMQACWQDAFPPSLAQPVRLLWWLIVIHASELVAYPLGGERGASSLTLLCCLAGIALLWRSRRFGLVWLCLAPLGLMLVPAALHRYPYGGMTKFQFFLSPLLCIVAGLGGTVLLARLTRRAATRSAGAWGTLAILLAVGIGIMGRDIFCPAKSLTDQRMRDFARWFWFSMGHDGEVVCLRNDLKGGFSPKTYEWGFSAMYLCNQRIYSPRHRRGEAPDLARVSAQWPLRCVDYRSSQYEHDAKGLDAWLTEMKSRYDLVGQERYPFTFYNKRNTFLVNVDYLEVYKFVPKANLGHSPVDLPRPVCLLHP